jgi:hypothetical protein
MDLLFILLLLGTNKLYLNKGNFKFEDISKAGIEGSLVNWCRNGRPQWR